MALARRWSFLCPETTPTLTRLPSPMINFPFRLKLAGVGFCYLELKKGFHSFPAQN